MDPSRRAVPPTPIPENRRIADIYRPITTAAYGTPVPLVIGQQRVPATVFRDGRYGGKENLAIVPTADKYKVLYGLCEAPVAAIPTEYGNDNGKTRPGYVPGQSAHLSFPIAYVAVGDPPPAEVVHTGDYITSTGVNWAAFGFTPAQINNLPAPEDLSFEVSSDFVMSGGGIGTYLISSEDGNTAQVNEDAVGLPGFLVSDFHVCTTGSGDTAVQWLVRFDRVSNSIFIRSRTGSGAWGSDATLCSGSVNASLQPAADALVQPRVAAVGNTVHVVWSVLSNTGSATQIAHVWTINGGTTWTAGQSLSLVARTSTTGVWKLSVNVHASGEVWIGFQRYSTQNATAAVPYPSKGVVVGFLPSTMSGSTPWMIPTLSPTTNAAMTASELCVFSTPSILAYSAGYQWRLRAPSILPLGGGKALLSVVFMDWNGAISCQLMVLPIIADTEVHWDFPTAAFAMWLDAPGGVTKNIAYLPWVIANGFAGQTLSYQPSAEFDNLNDASTQIIATGGESFGVLVLTRRAQWGTGVRTTKANHAMAGRWAMPWGSWNGTALTWKSDAMTWQRDGYLAHAFYNGNNQVYVVLGTADTDENLYDYRARNLALYMVNPGQSQDAAVLTFSPGTATENSLLYQFWAYNGTVLVSGREDEDIGSLGAYTVGIREVRPFSGTGDVLPSVIASRLLWNDLRGLNIANLEFDDATWNQMDNYCRAMGIKFSLALTSQQAAWPLVCDILESANAMPYMSEGKLKVYVRETAALTANGSTYTPMWNTGLVIPPEHLRDGIAIETEGIDASWNSLRVGWKNRARAYADEPYQIDDSGSIARKSRIPGSAMDWPWICMPNVAAACAWLRMRHHQRTGRVYRFALDQRYMLLEVADIVAISMPPNYAQRWVRILTIEESDAGWREMTAEDAPIATSVVTPPAGGSGSTGSTIITPTPVNLPILFVALIGGILQVWALLSWPAPGRGCNVWQSWDGVNYSQVGSCVTPSPTGHLIQDMTRLRVQPGLRCRPGLRVAVADFAMGDYSESGQTPPFPTWGDWQAGNPGALLWVNGELMAYALESDDDRLASCSMLRRGLYDTEVGQHPVLARVGAVTDSAWTWPVPPGRAGATCYFRFPGFGEDVANVATYSVEIPA